MNFYIADTHFGHNNVIRFDNRPFLNINEMNNKMIENWNRKVSNADTVYILGDFSWLNEEATIALLKKLRGKKILIRGNHDKVVANNGSSLKPAFKSLFLNVYDYLEISDCGEKVILSHYPIPFWNGQFRNSIHLYGHVHNSHQWNVCENLKSELRQLQDLPMRMYNVGCMMEWMDYTPRTLREILADAT